MYIPEVDNNAISTPLLTIIGVSPTRTPYGIHMEEDIILRAQKVKEYTLVLFFVYNRYMKISLAIIEKHTAV
jgi:hypothetical protein